MPGFIAVKLCPKEAPLVFVKPNYGKYNGGRIQCSDKYVH